jgi:hypothetical protein
MPIGLKIYSKSNSLLYNLAWIAGVDYEDNNHDNNNNNYNNCNYNQDEMHPDKIAALAQNHQEVVNPEVDTQDQEVNDQDQDQDQNQEDHESKIKFKMDDDPKTEEEPEPENPLFNHLIISRSGKKFQGQFTST